MKLLRQIFVLSYIIISSDAILGDLFYTANELWAKLYDLPIWSHPTILDEYDFIIIGSGSAGAVVANRLSENPNWKILLLEVGSPPNEFSLIPYYAVLYQLTPYNWGYKMEKQEGVCNAMKEEMCAWPRGKALGGTTTINYMIYTRGNPMDYEKWAAQGNPGWSYKDVLPYYLKSEDCHLGDICQNEFHGSGGLLSTAYPYKTKISDAFIAGGEELGTIRGDYNSDKYMRFSRIQSTQKNGRRHSVKTAFLDPIKKRANLHILTLAFVTKIIIDTNTNAATGVEYHYKNKTYTVKAKKEVILSAGTFNSPQLLMLSGVGPEAHLKECGIPVIKNLPVGQTLYDHITQIASLFILNQPTDNIVQGLNPINYAEWLLFGKGVMTSNSGIDNLGYIKTNISQDTEEYPDIEILLNSFGSLNYDFGAFSKPELRIKQEVYDKYYRPLVGLSTYGIIPMLLHPKSKGCMKLRSNNPFDPPKLYGNYYTDPEGHDMKTMISAVRYAQRHAKTEAMQKFGATAYKKPFPGCESLDYDSDSYWECVLRSATVSVHHQTSTCKMGPETDPEAVVDNRLRVYGIKQLRVADTSIIPVTLSGHTNAPSIMIGEKLGDILKEDWKDL